jgi:putative transcriptional regulator
VNDENFNGIMAGLEDAVAFAGGDTARGRVVSAVDVKAIRKAVRKTQRQFAETYHLPFSTVRDWEQHVRQPDAPARVLLQLIERDPKTIEQLIAAVPA